MTVTRFPSILGLAKMKAQLKNSTAVPYVIIQGARATENSIIEFKVIAAILLGGAGTENLLFAKDCTRSELVTL